MRAALVAAALALALPAAAAPPHGKPFWQGIVVADYAVPEGESVEALTLELVELLGSPDPNLRDGIGYEVFARWVYRDGRLGAEALERVRLALQKGLAAKLGETATDSAFRRSFSALDLSVLAAYDLKAPFLTEEAFSDLLGAALAYLGAEKDLRGFEPKKGWVHATAHTADLLKFLARSPRLTPEGQGRIVEAVAQKLRTAGVVFTWGEDERLAAALLSLARRKDAGVAPFEKWLASLTAEHEALWKGPLDPKAYVAVRAQKNALAHLAALLFREPAGAVPEALVKGLSAALSKMPG